MAKGKEVKSSPLKVAILRFLMRCLAIMPMAFGKAIARLYAWLSRLTGSRAYTTSIKNLEVCLPELNPQQRQQLAKQSLIHTGLLFSEAAKVWQQDNNERWIGAIYGEDQLQHTLAQGRGVLITGAHIGNWEVALYYLGSRYPFHCMYRPPRQLEMDEVISKGRCKNDTTMVKGNSRGVLHLIESLQQGQVAAILSDQEPGRRAGVFVPFFGKPALTMTIVQKVQQKSQAALFQIAAIRNATGNYDIHLQPIRIDPEQDQQQYAAQVNQQLEQMIRRYPEQYQWSYKRFKSTEDGSPNIYRK